MKGSLPLRCDLQRKGEGSPEDMEEQLARYDQNPGGPPVLPETTLLLLLCSKALGKLGDMERKPFPLLWQSQTESWSSASSCHTSKLATAPGTSSTSPSPCW